MVQAGKKIARLTPETTVFFECDIQVRIAKAIHRFNTVAFNAGRLTQTAKAFNIPILSTKQVNFGDTSEEITKHHFDGVQIVEKKTFSMLNSDTLPYLESLKRKSVVLYGVEAHICMKQTCMDLLA